MSIPRTADDVPFTDPLPPPPEHILQFFAYAHLPPRLQRARRYLVSESEIEINVNASDGELAWYVHHLTSGADPRDKWVDVPQPIREAWENAARAVHVAVLGRIANAVGSMARQVASGAACGCENCVGSRATNQPTAHH